MRAIIWTIVMTVAIGPLLPNAAASISGRSLYGILSKGLVAADAVNALPADRAGLEKLMDEIRPAKTSPKSVPVETEAEARRLLSALAAANGDAFRSAFFQAVGLPTAESMQSQSYPRPGRVRQVAGFIAELRANAKYDNAYREKVLEAANRKIGRPAEGETVTMYINKRKVSGPIRYHKNTFDIGIVTFPNEDLPLEYRLELIQTRQAEYLSRHFTERRGAYIKKGTDKIASSAMQAGHYLVLDGEWFAPDEAVPALEYFLRLPKNDNKREIKPIDSGSVIRRIQEGNNPTTRAVAGALLRFTNTSDMKESPAVISAETYSALLTYWQNSQAAKNNPRVSAGLPPSDAPENALHAAAMEIMVTMLMEP